MIPPKLLPSQELSLRRITLQQHGLVSHFASHDAGTLNASIHSANVSGSSSSFPRQSASRSELTSPLTLSGPGQVSSPFLPTKTPNSSFGPITGGGTNSTAPASIARPAIRDSKKWASALENVAGFDFPEHQLHASQPSTRERIMVQYVSDKYDRQWIAQRENSKMTTARAIATKGKTGSIDYPNAASSSAVSSSPASRHTITISLLEDLITAFELGTYLNPEIPIQRQPVLTFDGVIATGADASIIEEVRVYWLGKRQALGGNIPCIPSIHINVAEDNQMSLCHNDVLQFCPLPFNHREWSNTVLQRRIPHAHEEKNMKDTSSGVVKVEEGKATGQKRRRCDTGQALSGENTISENANEAASENEEWRALLTSGLELARAILDREEMKLVQTHVELYELAFLRKLAIEGRQSTETDASASLHTPRPHLPQQGLGGYAPQQQQQPPRGMNAQPQPQMAQQQQQQQHPQPEEHQDVVHDTQFDYYGQLLATASSDRTIGIHVVQNGQLQRIATLTGHEGPVWMVSWAHPRFGIALASASYDHKAIVWKESSQGSRQWIPVHVIDCHHGSVNAVQWAPESPIVATASSDGTVAVTVYEGGAWRESLKLSNNSNNIAHAMGATCVSFAPPRAAKSDMVLLASGGCDSQVRLWCLHGGNPTIHSFELLDVLDGHTDWVRDVAFAPLCSATRYAIIASCGQDKSVIIYRKSWDEVALLMQDRRSNSSTSGHQSQSLRDIDTAWERTVVLFDEPVWRISWSPAEEMLVVTTGDSEVYILREGGEFTQPWKKTPLSEYQTQ